MVTPPEVKKDVSVNTRLVIRLVNRPAISGVLLVALVLEGVSTFCVSTFCVSTFCVSAVAQDGPRAFGLDSRADNDPVLDTGGIVYVVPGDVVPLWKVALAREENELRRRTAEAIADAHRHGTEGLESLIPILRKILSGPIEDRTVHLATLRALVALNDRESAKELFAASQALGADAAEVLEPKLAEWGYRPVVAVWSKRVDDRLMGTRYRVLALRGLAAVGESEVAVIADQVSRDASEPANVRIEAAKAAGVLRRSGAEASALAFLQENSSIIDQLVATNWLLHHESERVVDILADVAGSAHSAVQRLAVERLHIIAPDRLVELYAKLAAGNDAKIRELAVKNMMAFPNEKNARSIGPALDDHHPDVRNAARDVFVVYSQASDELRAVVIEEVLKHLNGESWRGLQQATRIVGQIDHKPAAMRVVELLKSPRPEVHTTAAWSLRKLEVEETLEPAYQHAKDLSHWITDKPLPGVPEFKPVDAWSNTEDVAQLLVLFGLMGFDKAEDLMKTFVPKNSSGSDARVGAITALGYLHRGKAPQGGLVASLIGRLNDTESSMPEDERVRTACAIAMGRMKAVEGLPSLRHFHDLEGTGSPCGFACAWAIEQITGEPFKRSGPHYIQVRAQFLVPIK